LNLSSGGLGTNRSFNNKSSTEFQLTSAIGKPQIAASINRHLVGSLSENSRSNLELEVPEYSDTFLLLKGHRLLRFRSFYRLVALTGSTRIASHVKESLGYRDSFVGTGEVSQSAGGRRLSD
jgi:hypothetical protein